MPLLLSRGGVGRAHWPRLSTSTTRRGGSRWDGSAELQRLAGLLCAPPICCARPCAAACLTPIPHRPLPLRSTNCAWRQCWLSWRCSRRSAAWTTLSRWSVRRARWRWSPRVSVDALCGECGFGRRGAAHAAAAIGVAHLSPLDTQCPPSRPSPPALQPPPMCRRSRWCAPSGLWSGRATRWRPALPPAPPRQRLPRRHGSSSRSRGARQSLSWVSLQTCRPCCRCQA